MTEAIDPDERDWQKQFEAEQSHMIGSARKNWREIIVQNVNDWLDKRLDPTWSGNDDDIFGSHTAFIQFAVNNFDPLPAIQIWETEIAPAIRRAEAHLTAKGSPQARIHKGAPLFNVGVAYYAAGDFERAFGCVAEAGEENNKSGRGSQFPILIGDDDLSRRFLIRPLVKRYFAAWTQEYQQITGAALDETEFVALIKNLAKRPADAVQLILALHRFLKADLPFENHATKHIRTRAVAEALVALESTLRRSQPLVVGELGNQLSNLIAVNATIQNAYNTFNTDFNHAWPQPAQKRSPAAVNWSTTEAQARLAAAATPTQRAGVACYLALRLRNSLLHVVEDTLDIFQAKALCEQCMGIALGTIRLAKHGEEGTLTAL